MPNQFPKPLAWDVTKVAGRYFTPVEWARVIKLIRDDGVDQYAALEQVVSEREPGSIK
jgi:protein associated with RNAse G/E